MPQFFCRPAANAPQDAHQQKAAGVFRKAVVIAHRGARTSRGTTDKGGDRVELLEQFVQIVEPENFSATSRSLDQDIGAAGVAAIVQHDAIASIGELCCQRHELVMAAPAT